jgi:glycosyltransferase involved in cell wall biosynthesis
MSGKDQSPPPSVPLRPRSYEVPGGPAGREARQQTELEYRKRQLHRLKERYEVEQRLRTATSAEYEELKRQHQDLLAGYEQLRQSHAEVLAHHRQFHNDHLTLREIYRSRGWRLLCYCYKVKHHLKRLVRRSPRTAAGEASLAPREQPPSASPGEEKASPPALAPPAARREPVDRVGGPRIPSTQTFRVVYVLKPGVHDAACTRYRGFNLIEALRLSGVEASYVDEGHLGDRLGWVLSHDLIVLTRRALNEPVARLIDAARKAEVPLVYDIDDFLFDDEVVAHSDWFRRVPPEQALAIVRGYKLCFERCDYFTGATEFLVERAAERGKLGYRVPNGLNLAQLELSRRALEERLSAEPVDAVRLGYFSGTRTHQADFRLIAPVLVDLLGEFPRLRLAVVGDFDLGEFPEFHRYHHRIDTAPFMDWRDLPAALGRVDVNLIPLEVNPFTEGKSDLKYYEAALLKVPSVASPTRVYQRSITHGVNGLLAATPGEWRDALRSLVADARRRRSLGQKAYEHALAEYVPEAVAREALTAYRAILRDHRRRRGVADGALTVTFLVSDLGRALAEHAPALPLAAELVRLGACVTVLLPPGGAAAEADRLLAAHLLEPLFAVEVGDEVPCCDVLVAADAPSARRARAFAHRAGHALYLVQRYEPACPADDAAGGYGAGLPLATFDPVLAEVLRRRHRAAVSVLPAWVEPPEAAPAWPKPRRVVADVGPPGAGLWPGAAAALAEIHRLHPDVEILLCGTAGEGEPPPAVPHRRIIPAAGAGRAALLAETPVWVAWSPGGVALSVYEVMAAGCPVVFAEADAECARLRRGLKGVLAVPSDAAAVARAPDARLVDTPLQTARTQEAVRLTDSLPCLTEVAQTFLALVSDPADGGASGAGPHARPATSYEPRATG